MLIDEHIIALFKRNWRHTLTYWSVFFSFGLCIAFLGPTVLDLRCQTKSTLQEITWVFFSQQFCLLVGSSVGGFFKKTLLSSLSALAISTLLISVVFAIIPLCHQVVMLALAMAIAGLAMGVIDTIANLQLVKLYQKDSTIFLQALHFFVGFGALVSPLIADPFLLDTNCMVGNGTDNTTSDIRHHRHKIAGGFIHSTQNTLQVEQEAVSNVSYAFWIMALINLPIPVAVLMLMYWEKLLPCSNRSPPLLDQEDVDMKTIEGGQGNDLNYNAKAHQGPFICCFNGNLRDWPISYFGIHILGGMVLFFCDGIIGSYAGFVYSYAVDPPMSLPHKTAGYLSSIFWASIMFGRLMSIPLSYYHSPVRLITASLVGVIVVQFLLLLLYYSNVFLFIGTCFLGVFISSIFPCMLVFTEDILDYKGCATTVLVTFASLGEMVLQLLVGSLIQSKGSYSFLQCSLISGCLALTLFVALRFISFRHKSNVTATCKEMPMTETSYCVKQ